MFFYNNFAQLAASLQVLEETDLSEEKKYVELEFNPFLVHGLTP